jgi:hypothetical protein
MDLGGCGSRFVVQQDAVGSCNLELPGQPNCNFDVVFAPRDDQAGIVVAFRPSAAHSRRSRACLRCGAASPKPSFMA